MHYIYNMIVGQKLAACHAGLYITRQCSNRTHNARETGIGGDTTYGTVQDMDMDMHDGQSPATSDLSPAVQLT